MPTAEKPATESPAGLPTLTDALRVTGNSVNIRTGPGTAFDVVKAVSKGTLLVPAVTIGWRPILIGDEVFWISAEYTEEVKS